MDRTDFPKGEGLPRTDRSGGGLADAGRDYVACARPDVEGAYLPGQHEVGGCARNGHNSCNARRNRCRRRLPDSLKRWLTHKLKTSRLSDPTVASRAGTITTHATSSNSGRTDCKCHYLFLHRVLVRGFRRFVPHDQRVRPMTTGVTWSAGELPLLK